MKNYSNKKKNHKKIGMFLKELSNLEKKYNLYLEFWAYDKYNDRNVEIEFELELLSHIDGKWPCVATLDSDRETIKHVTDDLLEDVK